MFVEDSEQFSGINGAVKWSISVKEQKHNFHVHKWHAFLQILSDFLIAIQKNGKYVVTALTRIKTFFVHCVGLVTRLTDWKLKNDSKNVIKSCIQESIRIKKVKRKCLVTFDSDRMNCVLVMTIYIWTDFKISRL